MKKKNKFVKKLNKLFKIKFKIFISEKVLDETPAS